MSKDKPMDDIALNQAWAGAAFGAAEGRLPFSFVFGGQTSSDILSRWTRAYEESQEADGIRRLRLSFTDPDTGLVACAEAFVYSDCAGVDWTLSFTNSGASDAPLLERIRPLDTALAANADDRVILHRLKGSFNAVDDWLPYEDEVEPGAEFELAPVLGRSSNGECPFFNVSLASGGVIVAIGWSGQWCACVRRGSEGQVSVDAGVESLSVSLRPGETIRTPRILLLHWAGQDVARAQNLFRRTMLKHVVPKVAGSPVTPPIAHLSTSFYEQNEGTAADVLSHLASVQDVGFEFFWLDAYYTRGGFPDGMGNYGFPLDVAIPTDKYPLGLKPIGDAAHTAGMGFLLWFEPERVAEGTHIATQHPEWVISLEGKRSGLLNIGLAAARRYITDYLIAAIKEYGIDCLRIDFNIDPLPYWRSLDDEEGQRVGMAEVRYVEGLYHMWDDILRAHPHLFIDNCSSGGRRIDLETCSRSVPLWRTDATIWPLYEEHHDQAALQNQVMTAGLSRYVPFSVSGQMGAGSYWFRSGFCGGIPFCEDCRPSEFPLELLRAGIAEGKRIRKYYFGDFYTLSEVTTSARDWCVLQYHRAEEPDGIVVAFRRHESPYASCDCMLRDIDDDGTYEVIRATGYDRSEPAELQGADLRRMRIEIDERPGSVLLEYRRIAG